MSAFLVTGACWAAGVSAQPAPSAQDAAATGLEALRNAEKALVQLISAAEPSVVAVTRTPARARTQATPLFQGGERGLFRDLGALANNQSNPTPSGAGVVIDPAGLVLTQYLVVEPTQSHSVTTLDGKTYPATIKAADPRSGLAVLSVPGADLKPIEIGRAERLHKGSAVVTIGNPQAILSDGQPTASYGAVTNVAQKAGAQVNLNNTRDPRRGNYRTTLHHFGSLIQSDARLGWNASGGALIDLDGRLVGITTTVSVIAGHEQPAGYAIPLNAPFRRVVETLKEGKEVEYGLLGISFSVSATGRAPDGRNGIAVERAYPGGPAGRAGLRSGDIIVAVAGEPTQNADRLQLLVGREPPGAEVAVDFFRGAKPQQASVSLSKHFTLGQKVVTNPAPKWRGIRVDYPTAVSQSMLESASRDGLIDPQGCVVVADVDPESVSWEQGVRPGAFISHVGGARVTTPDEFWALVSKSDEPVSLRFTQPTTEPTGPADRIPQRAPPN